MKTVLKDEIKQWEVATLFHLNTALDVQALSLRRRIAAGATIEAGEYTVDVGEVGDLTGQGVPTDFNITGFNNVAWRPAQRRKRHGPSCSV